MTNKTNTNDNYQVRKGYTHFATVGRPGDIIESLEWRGWFIEAVTQDGKKHRIMDGDKPVEVGQQH